MVHITNLDKEFTVDHIIFKSHKIIEDGGQVKNLSRIVGVELNSVTPEGKIEKTVFHSKELVPLEVSRKGKLEAYKFINREGDYKDW